MTNQITTATVEKSQTFSKQYERDGYTVRLILSYSGKVDTTTSLEAVCQSRLVEHTARKRLGASSGGKWQSFSTGDFETADQAVQWLIETVVDEAKGKDKRHSTQGIAYDNAKEAILGLLGNEREYDEVE